MSTIRKNIVIASTAPGNTESGIVALPQLGAMANSLVDHSFFQLKGFPYCSRDNHRDLEPTLLSHPYLSTLSCTPKVTRFLCKTKMQYQYQKPSLHYDAVDKMDYPKARIHAPLLGLMY